MRLIVSLVILAALAGCAHTEPAIEVRTVNVPTPVPCVKQEDLPAEPASVRDQLTGDAVHDAGILAIGNLQLRQWGQELMALIVPGCITIDQDPR